MTLQRGGCNGACPLLDTNRARTEDLHDRVKNVKCALHMNMLRTSDKIETEQVLSDSIYTTNENIGLGKNVKLGASLAPMEEYRTELNYRLCS